MPAPDAIDTTGLNISKDDMRQLLSIDRDGWEKEIEMIREHYAKFGNRLPKELSDQLIALEARLKKA
jgi:phosphoenolpyruvate carboxykinase (GTP)